MLQQESVESFVPYVSLILDTQKNIAYVLQYEKI